MITSLLIISIIIDFIILKWSNYTYQDMKKYLINRGVKPVNFYLGLNFQFIDKYRFIRIYLKNCPHSKYDKKLFQAFCIQTIIFFVIFFTWIYILIFTNML